MNKVAHISTKRSFLQLLFISILLIPGQLLAQDQIAVALNFLNDHSASLQLSEDDFASPLITSNYTDLNTGTTHLYLRQQHNGIGILFADLTFAINAENEVSHMSGKFISELRSRVNTSEPTFSPKQALLYGIKAIGAEFSGSISVVEDKGGPAKEMVFSGEGYSLEEVPVKLMYYPQAEGDIRLVYSVAIFEVSGQNWWNLFIDATNGKVLSSSNWVNHCGTENHLAHSTTCSPLPPSPPARATSEESYHVFAEVPNPDFGGRTLVSTPADPLASPFGWHDTDGVPGAEHTITRGNNAWAQEDYSGNNQVGYSPDGGEELIFDHSLDLADLPIKNQDASVTNLFFQVNSLHDILYHYGFDETAGNFQNNNYGRGGLEEDGLFADAMDPAVRNGANFATPPDGFSPRMQMGIWDAGSPVDLFTVFGHTDANGTYHAIEAAFSVPIPAEPITAPIVLANDGVEGRACSPVINAGQLNRNIAMVDLHGDCFPINQVKNVQDAGAVACIVCNDHPGMPWALESSIISSMIPTIMISKADCQVLKAKIQSLSATLQNNGAPSRDSDFDNTVIIHEYAHGLTNRLTGGPDNVDCLLNEEQMGEGWSDWLAMLLTLSPEAVESNDFNRGFASWALSQPVDGWGYRQFPYSPDLSLNDIFYGDLANASEFPGEHGVGFIWASMLWDMSTLLIKKHGFDPDWKTGTGGNNLALKLVVNGLKYQPCRPGFVDARDAILKADQELYGGENRCLIWQAFADRGLGASADQGSSENRFDGTADFNWPSDCQVILDRNLVSMNAEGRENHIEVRWQMASDAEFSDFYITRRAASESFVSWSKLINGADISGASFRTNDSTAIPGIRYTYRLYKHELNGERQLLKTDEAMLEAGDFTEMKIYPNPARNTVTIEYIGEQEGRMSLQIANIMGTTVRYEVLPEGALSTAYPVDISALADGYYFLKITTKSKSYFSKIRVEK